MQITIVIRMFCGCGMRTDSEVRVREHAATFGTLTEAARYVRAKVGAVGAENIRFEPARYATRVRALAGL